LRLGQLRLPLGIRAQIGREIRPSDDMPGSPAVATISDAFSEREFARSADTIGKSIKMDDVSVTIIGVNPKGFTGAGSTLAFDAFEGHSDGLYGKRALCTRFAPSHDAGHAT
jgi:hypothetical protein